MRIALTVLLLSACPLIRLSAQCPDGSPPPCRSAGPAPAARRPPPPLDPRTWIVLPFENVARVADIDWLRDASVNLLYLDLSRWRDIRVVDDERVADLMREVPEVRANAQLSLQAGLAVARRAGAGKLVMGDLLKVGNRTQVVAKVFDVRSGQRVRTVRQETSIADSLMPIFGRLARDILDVAPPAGAAVGVVGTTSVGAYRAYVSGVGALNRVDLAAAHAHLDTALSHDSTFALAHYKLAVVIGWENPNDANRRVHAEAANRYGTSLPARERSLIQGLVHQANGRWGEACDISSQMLRSDSGDVEAWYNLGECAYHDGRIVFQGGDSTRPAFRSSWNVALRAFQRTLELDPTYHLAFSHIPDILQVDQRAGCRGRDAMTGCVNSDVFLAFTVRDGDSLLHEPRMVQGPQAVFEQQRRRANANGTWRANLEQSRRSAEAWVQVGPAESRAHQALGRTLLRLGRPEEAAREMAQVRFDPGNLIESQRYVTERLELLLKLDSAAAAARFADSLTAVRGLGQVGAFAAVLMGRLGRVDEIFGNFTGPPPMLDYFKRWPSAYAGVPTADFLTLERRVDSIFSGNSSPAAARGGRSLFLGSMIPWTLNLPRTPPPDLDTSSGDVRVAWSAAVVLGDTARTRRALLNLDSAALTLPLETPDGSPLVIAAEGWLLLGDSARALERLIAWRTRFPYFHIGQAMQGNFGNLTVNSLTWGRAWLRLGDLADAANRRDHAAYAYRQVVGMWSGGDPSLQPAVQRARAALARYGT